MLLVLLFADRIWGGMLASGSETRLARFSYGE